MQLLARLGSRPDITTLFPKLFPDGIATKDVYEFYGYEGTGKSELLLNIVCSIILPKNWIGFPLDGFDASVIFIDTDSKFSIYRLVTIMEKEISSAFERCISTGYTDATLETSVNKTDWGDASESKSIKETSRLTPSAPSEEDIENFIKVCLKRLTIIQCSSSSQILLTLHNLENTITSDPNIVAIMIDSISAFYWLDRFSGGDNQPAQELNMQRIVAILSKLVYTYNLVLFATKASVFKSKNKDSDLYDSNFVSEHHEFMCRAWGKFVQHRLEFSQADVDFNTGFNQISVKCPGFHVQFVITEAGIKFV